MKEPKTVGTKEILDWMEKWFKNNENHKTIKMLIAFANDHGIYNGTIKKIKKWNWVIKENNGNLHVTAIRYATEDDVRNGYVKNGIKEVLEKVEKTMEEENIYEVEDSNI